MMFFFESLVWKSAGFGLELKTETEISKTDHDYELWSINQSSINPVII